MAPKEEARTARQSAAGFDAPVIDKDSDHLDRWRFAKEISDVAITCPRDWSVRIGVYGDWGSGKTSVLSFVQQIAQKSGQVVVEFNPWEYRAAEALWQAFVLTLFREVRAQAGKLPGHTKANVKKFLGDCGKIVSEVSGLTKKTEIAAELGMPLLKKYTSLGKSDIKNIPGVLGDRRLIVLIDDLDRTDPQIVPQLLFAVKQILDLPGFSFVLAFDPQIVGEVLGEYHKGFGDGLKFLEKIVDYPRWLPPPSPENLMRLAKADISRYCPFVEESAIERIADILPQNPRSLRQYVRYVSSLKPYVDRHLLGELNWPIILTSNLLKLVEPRIAYRLFSDVDFWKDQGVTAMFEQGTEDKDAQPPDPMRTKIQEIADDLRISVEDSIDRMVAIGNAILSASPYLLHEGLHYQAMLSESPCAVTWKEFDSLLAAWRKKKTLSVTKWMQRHADAQEHSVRQVFHEVFDAAVRRRLQLLGAAADARTAKDIKTLLREANTVMTLLRSLIFRFGDEDPLISAQHFKAIKDMAFKYIAFDNLPEYIPIRKAEKKLLCSFAKAFPHDLKEVMNHIEPWDDDPGFKYDTDAAKELHKTLVNIIVPRYADQLLSRLREPGFVPMIRAIGEHYPENWVFFGLKSIVWKSERRRRFLKTASEAAKSTVVHANIYEFLYSVDLIWRDKGPPDFKQTAEKILSTKSIIGKLWEAATVSPLNPRAVGSLKEFPERIRKAFKIDLCVPTWWSVESVAPKKRKVKSRKKA